MLLTRASSKQLVKTNFHARIVFRPGETKIEQKLKLLLKNQNMITINQTQSAYSKNDLLKIYEKLIFC